MRIIFLPLILLLLPLMAQSQERETRPPIYNNSELPPRTQFDQVEDLKEQVRQLRGEIEQLQFENSQMKEKFTRLSADVELRFSEIKTQHEVKPTQKPEIKPEPKVESKPGDKAPSEKNTSVFDDIDKVAAGKAKPDDKVDTVKQQYQDAYTLFKNKDYKGSQAAFQKLISDHPKSEFANKSFYWLAEACYFNEQYDKAATNSLKSYQVDNKGLHAADSLFRLGKSMIKLKKNKEACTVYAKLKNEFPNIDSSLKKQVDEDIDGLKCTQ